MVMRTTTYARRQGILKACLYAYLCLLGVALVAGFAEKPAYSQPDTVTLAHSKIDFISYAALDEALEAAKEHYKGRLLIYFYNSTSPASEATERVIFGDTLLSGLANSHFARYAIEAHSAEAKQLLEEYPFVSSRNGPLEEGEPLLLFIDNGFEKAFSSKLRLKTRYPPEEMTKFKIWFEIWRNAGFMLNTLPDREFIRWMNEESQQAEVEPQ